MDTTPAPLSTRALLLSTGAAALLAAAVLLTVVLPAEWGVDPTGIGRAIGLTRLAGVEATQPEAGSADAVLATSPGEAGAFREDTVEIEVPPGTGLEYKFRLAKGATLDYAWATNRGMLFSQLHGEPQGDPRGYYEDFATSRSQSIQSSVEAPFDGSHGWYWKNDNDFPVTVTLTTRGVYEIIGKL
jgi:hypothetical protein